MQKISKDIPFYHDPVSQPPSKPVRIPMPEFAGKMDINPELNTNFKENSPFQEGVIWETYQRPDKSFFSRSSRIVQKLDLKIKTVTPSNHQSLQTEHRIKSINHFNEAFDQSRSDVAEKTCH